MISTIGVAFNIAIYKLWMISTIGVAFNIAIYSNLKNCSAVKKSLTLGKK